MPVLINFIAFQVGWFACVLGAAWGSPWAGMLVAITIVTWHLTRMSRPRQELVLVVAAAILGALWDSLLPFLGWIRYPNGMLIENTAPLWIVALWMLFATTLNVSLAWLKNRLWLAIAFGAIGGPMAYLGGEKLGALELVEPTAALVALAIGWAVLTPALLQLARRFDGFVNPRDALPVPETGHG